MSITRIRVNGKEYESYYESTPDAIESAVYRWRTEHGHQPWRTHDRRHVVEPVHVVIVSKDPAWEWDLSFACPECGSSTQDESIAVYDTVEWGYADVDCDGFPENVNVKGSESEFRFWECCECGAQYLEPENRSLPVIIDVKGGAA